MNEPIDNALGGYEEVAAENRAAASSVVDELPTRNEVIAVIGSAMDEWWEAKMREFEKATDEAFYA